MPGGYGSIRNKTNVLGECGDKFFMKNVKFYCKGRGCRHRGVPESKPTAICFYIKGASCTHKEVWDRIDDLLHLFPGARIEQIQFVPLAVHLDSLGTENRWVVTLSSVGARNRLAGTTLHITGQRVTLRRYDDIVQLEYKKCSRSTTVQSMMTQIQNSRNDCQDLVAIKTGE